MSAGKVIGDFIDDKVCSAPCSQRKPRLNRRGFHLSSHPLTKLLEDKSDEKKPVNGFDNTETKVKTDLSQKRIISLSSIKTSTSGKDNSVEGRESSNIICLKKRSFSPNRKVWSKSGNVTADVSVSDAPAPKKKHKPITWP